MTVKTSELVAIVQSKSLSLVAFKVNLNAVLLGLKAETKFEVTCTPMHHKGGFWQEI